MILRASTKRVAIGASMWRLVVELCIVAVAAAVVINIGSKNNAAKRLAEQRLLQAQAAQRDADEQREFLAQRTEERNSIREKLDAAAISNEQAIKAKESLEAELKSVKQGAIQLQQWLKAEQAAARDCQRDLSIHLSAIEGLLAAGIWKQADSNGVSIADVVDSGVKRMSNAGGEPGAETVAKLKVTMAQRLLDAGESDAALPLLQQATTTLASEAGSNDPTSVSARIQLARAMFDQGQHAAAVDELRKTLEAFAEPRNADANTTNRRGATQLLLHCLIETDRFAEAEGLARDIARMPESGQPMAPSSRTSAVKYLFPVLEGLGKHDELERVARQIIASDAATVHSSSGFHCRCYLARALLAQNKLDELAPIESELKAAAASLDGGKSLPAPGLYGQLLMRRGDIEAAERYLLLAVREETAKRANDIRKRETLKAIIELYESSGRVEQATQFRQQLNGSAMISSTEH